MESNSATCSVRVLLDEFAIDKAEYARKLGMIPGEEEEEGALQCQAKYEAKGESVPDIH